MSRILFFDLETSGLVSTRDEILNIAAMVYNEETRCIESEYNEFVKPSKPISYMITQLTGITNRQVANCYCESIVFMDFMNWVAKQNCDKVAGHNILRFDLRWMAEKARHYKVENTLPKEALDTLPMAKKAYDDGLLPNYNYTTEKGNLSFKQEYLMDYYNLGVQEHLAITDVQYDVMIYQRLKDAEANIDYGF